MWIWYELHPKKREQNTNKHDWHPYGLDSHAFTSGAWEKWPMQLQMSQTWAVLEMLSKLYVSRNINYFIKFY